MPVTADSGGTGLLPRALTVRGARQRNLRGVDVDLPHRTLAVFTGVSGSGKSSLAFATIYEDVLLLARRGHRSPGPRCSGRRNEWPDECFPARPCNTRRRTVRT